MADLDLYTGTETRPRSHLKACRFSETDCSAFKGLHSQVMDVDELIQVGMVGLIEAFKTSMYRVVWNLKFSFRTRIRGAILDEVRRISVLPRSAISHIRDTNEATQELATSLGRTPTQTELAKFMGKDVSEYQKERSHAHQMMMVDSEAAEDESAQYASTTTFRARGGSQ